MSMMPMSYDVSDKRQRVVTVRRANRPINKQVIVVNQNLTDVQTSTAISAPPFPATMVGLRWDLSFHQAAGTSVAHYIWAIIFLGQGETIDSLTFTDGANLYTPEKNLLVWGFGAIENGSETKNVSGSTKTMRKMMLGDQIVFIGLGILVEFTEVHGAVQLFMKA